MENIIELQCVNDKSQLRLCLNCGKELTRKQEKFCSRSCTTSHRNSMNTGENANNWRGGKSINSEGYVRIRMPEHPNACDGYVFEHRYVMEQEIGRLLTSKEVVHHINEVPDDNRIENLMLFKDQSEHMRYHNELRKKKIS